MTDDQTPERTDDEVIDPDADEQAMRDLARALFGLPPDPA